MALAGRGAGALTRRRRARALLLHGEPLVAECGAEYCCMLCRQRCADTAALDRHLAAAAHEELVAAGLRAGTLACRPAGLGGRIAAVITTARSAIRLVRALVFGVPARLFTWCARSAALNDAQLWLCADRWPRSAPAPPRSASETLAGPFSLDAHGLEVRQCDERLKGQGVFARRPLPRGEIIGVYLGEGLSQRDYALRHSGYDPSEVGAGAAGAVAAARSERLARFGALSADLAPIRGARNGGTYVFELLSDGPSYPDDRVACIDGEDPTRSSWCRYINHAPSAERACNLRSRVDAHRQLVWFETAREIEAGEELHFDYWRQTGRLGRLRAWLGALIS